MLARRLPPSLRRYATRVVAAPPKKAAAPPQPAPPKPQPLKSRLLAASQKLQTQKHPPPKPLDAESAPNMSEAERQSVFLKEVMMSRERLKKLGHTPPPLELPLLDHAIPYAVSFKSRSEYPSVRAMYDQFWKNIINHGKNAFSMRHIALADSFPGITIDPSLNWAKRTYLYTRRVFEAQSLKPAAWVTPMRQEFLDQYIKLNNTLTQDSSRLLVLTVKPYQDEALALARRQLPGYRYKWNFHREVSPTRIISLRAADGNFDKKMPETGTRVAVQALVRFDTEQSVEIYDRQGNAVHTPALTAEPQPVRVGKALNVVPAERKRVTEYLVLDKQMHELDAQWRFRARYVPTPGRTVAV